MRTNEYITEIITMAKRSRMIGTFDEFTIRPLLGPGGKFNCLRFEMDSMQHSESEEFWMKVIESLRFGLSLELMFKEDDVKVRLNRLMDSEGYMTDIYKSQVTTLEPQRGGDYYTETRYGDRNILLHIVRLDGEPPLLKLYTRRYKGGMNNDETCRVFKLKRNPDYKGRGFN